MYKKRRSGTRNADSHYSDKQKRPTPTNLKNMQRYGREECPSAEDGMERFACPSADRMGRYRCIDDHVLCDGFIDCPQGEDEDRMSCMFYKTTKAHLDVLADALLRKRSPYLPPPTSTQDREAGIDCGSLPPNPSSTSPVSAPFFLLSCPEKKASAGRV
ncbi:hypothetical protein HPB47_022465 [Ixodes persulcatus]|uniref:Uncharacterized protein n=1 Tax=Ixodes persulcatus TaxID=34615 RepID=A0AC60QA23_IXOPE|nr:hypothetical protein HPB47_022465 [Ixodes persulcatus]